MDREGTSHRAIVSPEAIIGLSRLVENTTHVIVGTSILLLPLYPPALVAKQVADLDAASGGRVVLGVGVGGEYPGVSRHRRAHEWAGSQWMKRSHSYVDCGIGNGNPYGPILPNGGRDNPSGSTSGH